MVLPGPPSLSLCAGRFRCGSSTVEGSSKALALLAQRLSDPSFPPAEFEELRRESLISLRRRPALAYRFRLSRISRSNSTSSAGNGAASATAGNALRLRRLTCLIMMKMMKARMTKFTRMVRKLP
jgi:hypothetical protein